MLITKSQKCVQYFPVFLSFKPPNLDKNTRFVIPEWIAKHAKLHKRIATHFDLLPKRSDRGHPVKQWLYFKKVAIRVARCLMREFRNQALNRASTLTNSISVYRHLLGGGARSRAKQLCRKDEKLEKYVDAKDDLVGLKKHIERVYRANPFREPEGTKTAASIGALQKERKQFTHLFRDDGSIVEEPTEMATDLKVH